ncbi:hypothetical protein SFUMM280S_03235 [Streptomyces fumanus]
MSGTPSPLASGVPMSHGMLSLPHPEAPYVVSTPPAEAASVPREARTTPPPVAAMPLRSSSRPVASLR